MGEEATRIAIRLADGVAATTPRMDLATSLVVRDSTAVAPVAPKLPGIFVTFR